MPAHKIVILSSRDEYGAKLESLLKGEQYNVVITEHIDQAADKISNSEVAFFLISYDSIVKSERKVLAELFKNARQTKFVVYNVPNDATRRLAFYRLGAYRILNNECDVEELFYFVNNALRKIKPDSELKEPHFSGSLQDFNLAGLIMIIGRERRSGILRIRTPVSTGKIYFNQGSIVHAISGNIRGDDAVFYMLTWTKGWFSMRPLPLESERSRIQLSNIGILLRGEKTRGEFIELVNSLGGLNRQIRVINQGDLLLQRRDKVYQDFILYLSEFREIHDIVEFSPYDMIETLTVLNKFKESKNLEFRESVYEIGEVYVEEEQDTAGLGDRLLNAEEVVKFQELLSAQNVPSGKLIILGTNTCGKTDFIRIFNQGSLSSVRTKQDLDFTKVELSPDFYLQVFGIALDRRLTEIVEKLSEGLLGYIFLVDAEKSDEFEYTNYIINHLTGMFDVPWAIAVTNLNKDNIKLFKKINEEVKTPDKRELIQCNVADKEDVRRVLFSMALLPK